MYIKECEVIRFDIAENRGLLIKFDTAMQIQLYLLRMTQLYNSNLLIMFDTAMQSNSTDTVDRNLAHSNHNGQLEFICRESVYLRDSAEIHQPMRTEVMSFKKDTRKILDRARRGHCSTGLST